jgi:DNA-binding response OmpR family regulator
MLTYTQLANPASWTTMNPFPQPSTQMDGYALVVGSHEESLHKLTTTLWEHGVPGYAAPNVEALDTTVAARGKPAFLLLLVEQLSAAAIVGLETFRIHHDVPLLCITPAGPQPPHVQALLHMATDFITTPYQPQELFLRIRRLKATASPLHTPPALPMRTPPAPPRGTQRLSAAEHQSSLSDTERKILARLSERLGEPVPLEDLLALIPGGTPGAQLKLLRVHIFRLRQKIEPTPKDPVYLRTVREFGYYLTSKVDGIE